MIGKRVFNHVYWHISLTSAQDSDTQKNVSSAENLANLTQGIDFNVIKYDINGELISLLWYPDFFHDPFPALEFSFSIDLNTKRVEKRSYQSSLNPPILHRKELLLSNDDPRVIDYRQLTAIAEQIGLFKNTINIGFKRNWEALIAEKGFQLLGNEFIPIGNVEAIDESPIQSPNHLSIYRHLTALSRINLSAPMQCLARHGYLNGTLSVFDYGCGKGDDIKNLRNNNISVSGYVAENHS